ncbi:hypothetical protein C8256_19680 [Kluyvera genomosp. 2]|uniref:Uncharacterized protein n=1 Tax=Kluyvera genomosp. 2 TaxID=2774054 RepID=A0A2T2XXZ0_9ENTR|nr:hypothetical protein C8256_19680 [Kluyvera genomosp. 2]
MARCKRIQEKILPKSAQKTFLLRKRKENKCDLSQYVNTNENYYQFDVVLILLVSDFVIYVLEIHSG